MAEAKTNSRNQIAGAVVFGLYAPLLTGGAYLWWTRDISIEAVDRILPIDLGLCVVVPILIGLIMQRDVRTIGKKILLTLMGSFFVNFMIVSSCMGLVGASYANTQTLQEFVKQDFAWVDTGNSGKVTAAQVRAILDSNSALQQGISDLDRAQQQIDYAVNDHLQKDQVDRQIDGAFKADEQGRLAARQAFDSLWPTADQFSVVKTKLSHAADALRAKLLAPERLTRVAVLDREICAAGDRAGWDANGASICEATRDQLLNYGQKLEQKYPFWVWASQKVEAALEYIFGVAKE
jgi:hypothetical protein